MSEKPFIIYNKMNDEWKTIYYLNGVFKYFFIRMCPSLIPTNVYYLLSYAEPIRHT